MTRAWPQDALVAKLQPGIRESPLNDGIYQSIRLVEGFLNACKESEAELEALKAQIKRLMMQQVSGDRVRRLGEGVRVRRGTRRVWRTPPTSGTGRHGPYTPAAACSRL